MMLVLELQAMSINDCPCLLPSAKKHSPAKIANFSDIGGWAVIGRWESSLVDSKEFYRPIITPFELELALQTGT
jgi:diphthamide biosynthesis enzyme Dph1/Dph2-like protein